MLTSFLDVLSSVKLTHENSHHTESPSSLSKEPFTSVTPITLRVKYSLSKSIDRVQEYLDWNYLLCICTHYWTEGLTTRIYNIKWECHWLNKYTFVTQNLFMKTRTLVFGHKTRPFKDYEGMIFSPPFWRKSLVFHPVLSKQKSWEFELIFVCLFWVRVSFLVYFLKISEEYNCKILKFSWNFKIYTCEFPCPQKFPCLEDDSRIEYQQPNALLVKTHQRGISEADRAIQSFNPFILYRKWFKAIFNVNESKPIAYYLPRKITPPPFHVHGACNEDDYRWERPFI